nr:uncharacterized protein CI109_004015 [Kwoniella shandongensis]KAA5527477.1 hypothetical protein CI109_004015 [Kwoniella shandongensis]
MSATSMSNVSTQSAAATDTGTTDTVPPPSPSHSRFSHSTATTVIGSPHLPHEIMEATTPSHSGSDSPYRGTQSMEFGLPALTSDERREEDCCKSVFCTPTRN